jgi:hypothetical protein
VFRADKTTGTVAAQSFSSPNQYAAQGLLVDDTNAYFLTSGATGGGMIWRGTKDLGFDNFVLLAQMIPASGAGFPGLALYTSSLFFTASGDGVGLGTEGVYTLPTTSAPEPQLVPLLPFTGATMGGILADSTGLYFALQPTPGGAWEILRDPASGGNLLTLATDLASVDGLALASGNLYFSAGSVGLQYVPTSGTLAPTSVTNSVAASGCSAMTAGGGYVYCASDSYGTVLEVASIGASTTSVKTLPNTGTPMAGIAADCNTVYFAAGNQIGMIPRQ